jgi:hypothetical protein
MNLKELMGDAFKDGITVEEITSFFEGKKFADLGTGQYVDKNKFDNTVNDLNKKLTDANNQLSAKMTDEEKSQQAQQEQVAEIERLKKLLSENTINGNKNTVVGVLTSTRDTLGVDATDKDFNKFVENITTEDGAKSTEVANYVAKVVKDAYEKGKQDATKDSMGNFGKGKGQSSDEDGDKIGEIGKRLAGLNKPSKETFDYFKK